MRLSCQHLPKGIDVDESAGGIAAKNKNHYVGEAMEIEFVSVAGFLQPFSSSRYHGFFK